MKNKKIFVFLACSLLLLLILIFSLVKLYDLYVYETLNKIVYTLENVYPDMEIDMIDALKGTEDAPEVLTKYGIDLDTVSELGIYQDFRVEIVFLVIVVFLLFLFLFFFFYF